MKVGDAGSSAPGADFNNGDLALTYALIYDFLTRKSHMKAAEAVKKAAKDIVVFKNDLKLQTNLEGVLTQWKALKTVGSTSTKRKKGSDSSSGSSSDSSSSSSSDDSDSDSSSSSPSSSSESDSDSEKKTKSLPAEKVKPASNKIEKPARVTKAQKVTPPSSKTLSSGTKDSDEDNDSDASSSSSSSSSDSDNAKKQKTGKEAKKANDKKVESSDESSSNSDSSGESSSEEEAEKPAAVKDQAKKGAQAAVAPKKKPSSDSSSSSLSASDSDSDSSSSSSSSDSGVKSKKTKTKAVKSLPVTSTKPASSREDDKPVKKRRISESGTAVVSATVGTQRKSAQEKEGGSHAALATKSNGVPNGKNGNGKDKPRKTNTPFQRVKADEIQYSDERLKDNTFESRGAGSNDYGERAARDLIFTRGSGFRKEKNKKKRGSYRGGEITLQSYSIKFD